MRVGIDHEGDALYGSRTASVTLDGVFFRMDEWVSGPELSDRIAPALKAFSIPGLVPAPDLFSTRFESDT